MSFVFFKAAFLRILAAEELAAAGKARFTSSVGRLAKHQIIDLILRATVLFREHLKPEFVDPYDNQLQSSFVERAEPKHQQIIA